MDKSNTPPYRDPGECSVCRGIAAEMKSCHACHGTGRKSPQNIITFPTPTAQRVLRNGTTCACVKAGMALWGGDATPCPICNGATMITRERAVDIYHLILRHQHELPPLSPTDSPTQPIGVTLDVARHRSPFGAYSIVGKFRVYLEPTTPDRFHVYVQDDLHPVGREGRMLTTRNATLDDLATWAMMPSPHEPIWWPLPKESARQLEVAGA